MGVGKPKRSSGAFSTSKPEQGSKLRATNGSVDHAAKEQRAVALIKEGKLHEAEELCRELIAARPNDHIAYCNLAAVCGMQGRLDEVIDLLRISLRLEPSYPDAHNNIGNALLEMGDLAAAIAAYNTAVELNPSYPDAHSNLGNALLENGDLDGAIAAYNTALQLKPDHPDAHWNSSSALLLCGDYKNGWEQYEWRAFNEASTISPKADQWHGDPPLNKNSKLLLVCEQGLGDTLQFMRYAIALRNQGIAVSLCAPPKLHSLVKASGIDPFPLTPEQANQVSEGQWIPLLSVPRR
jgi:tetratricopeptide (TPR) repeat protein